MTRFETKYIARRIIATASPLQHRVSSLEIIQEVLVQSACHISQHNLSEGFDLCKSVVKSLALDLSPTSSGPGQGALQLRSSVTTETANFSPFLSNTAASARAEGMSSCMGEIFCFPFTISFEKRAEMREQPRPRPQQQPQQPQQQEAQKPLEEIIGACASVCLFNMGLCTQIEAMRDGRQGNKGKALQTASVCYTRAWSCLRLAPLAQEISPGTPADTMFLLMAISTNLAMCRYYLGDVDGYNEWSEVLETIFNCSRVCMERASSNSTTLADAEMKELHNFFWMICALKARCIAAAAA